jgi:hypothetical protein
MRKQSGDDSPHSKRFAPGRDLLNPIIGCFHVKGKSQMSSA